ncbi:MAG: hypothetical protein LAT68_11135 [Cyclobacteriaceae bacterium]|nr:hypothetical protein [Cyclobacteriaceae bacterium]MCH8516869.1 hypothetical protein [Cyclobacteriaceae bacterium]
MKQLIFIAFMLMLSQHVKSQSIDYSKMNRELEISKTVLKGMLNENRDPNIHWVSQSNDIEAQYVSDYGVIFSIPRSYLAATARLPKLSNKIQQAIDELEYDLDFYEDYKNDSDVVFIEKDWDDKMRAFTVRTLKSLQRTQRKEEIRNLNVEQIKLFMIDYGHLISQLRDEDRIKVKEKEVPESAYWEYSVVPGKMKANMSFELSVAEVRAFQKGEISEEEALSRIVITTEGPKPSVDLKDVMIFKSVIDRLYQSDLSSTYYLRKESSVEYQELIGVILNMDFVSSNSYRKQLFIDVLMYDLPTRGLKELNQSERDEEVKKIYPIFEKELIQNILEYGKNIESLKANESILVSTHITECKGCEIPSLLKINVPAQLLEDLKKGSKTKSEAESLVKIERLGYQ